MLRFPGDSEIVELVDDPDDPLDNRNSMLSSIMKDFDDQSKDWLNSSIASSQPSQRGEILIWEWEYVGTI